MTDTTPSVDLEAVGKVVEGPPYTVTRDEIVAFAKATNDETPDCLAGRVAPPIYALNPILYTMVAAKKRAALDFGFHGEHDIQQYKPILPGMTITPVAEVIGVHGRSSGATVTVKVLSHASGTLLNEQYFVSFLPGAKVGEDRGKSAPPHDVGPEEMEGKPVTSSVVALAANQTRRYADASNDHDAYTLDDTAAQAMGFPTKLVHGMLTFAISAGTVVSGPCGGAPDRLSRIAVRLSRPLFLTAGQAITTRVWHRPGAEYDGRATFVFHACNREGEVVLTNGVAEVRQ